MSLIPHIDKRVAAWLGSWALAVVAASPSSAEMEVLPRLINDRLSVTHTCTSLMGAMLKGGSVTSATLEPASDAKPSAYVTIPNRPKPAHCLVNGVLNKRTGIDGKPYGIGFELRMPVDWNGRFLFQGGGGMDGRIMPADGALFGQSWPTGLMKGYAVVSTDSGHQQEVGSANGAYLFGADPQARDEYGFQQIPLVHDAAVRLISLAYGQPPARNYFLGQSNGGRQGLNAAQRYPTLFDGIAVSMPANRSIDAALLSVYRAKLAARIAPRAADGSLDIDHPLDEEKTRLISHRILEACDALDGAEDGMVFESLSCRVDPMKWVCARGTSTSCLSRDEAIYVRDFLAGPKLRNGEQVYTRTAVDPVVVASMVKPDEWISFFPILGGFLSHVATTPPTITTDLQSYILNASLDSEYAKTRATSQLFRRSGVELMNANSSDLDAFMRHGGKLILTSGAADQGVSVVGLAEYMDSVLARYGKSSADGFVRFYIIPGFGHAIPYKQSTPDVDILQAVVDWVEHGKVPERLMAAALPDSEWPGRTRPLCTYPEVAIYNGQGSMENGMNFRCE